MGFGVISHSKTYALTEMATNEIKARFAKALTQGIKVAFFQKVLFFFQISKFPKTITPNHYPELEI